MMRATNKSGDFLKKLCNKERAKGELIMKKCRPAAALSALLLAALFLLSGCTSSTGKGEVSNVSMDVEQKEPDKIAKEPSQITFLSNGYANSNPEDPIYRGIQLFQKETGKTVKVVQSGDQAWQDKVIASISAGAPIDAFSSYIQFFLTFYQGDYIQPLDDYLTSQADIFDKPMMDRFAKYDGKYYSAGAPTVPYVMFYNKKLLSDNGFEPDEPRTLYEEGKWTWKEFKRIAGECHDTGAGINGFENMYNSVFLSSNDVSTVTFDGSKYELQMNNPRLKESLEMIQDIFFKNRIAGNGWLDGQANFIKGKAAFHGTYAYDEVAFLKAKENGEIKFDFGVTAFPAGPSNKDGTSMVHASGYCISNGAQAPYSAGRLIECILTETVAYNKTEKHMEGSLELFDALREHPAQCDFTDGILSAGNGSFYLLNAVFNGEDITKSIQEFTDQYQIDVNKANERIAGKE